MIHQNTKNSKWDKQWQSHIKSLSLDLDQTKNKQVGVLLQEGDALQTEKTTLTKEISQLKDEQKSLSQVFTNYREAQKEHNRLDDATNKTTHNPREANFLGTGTGIKWQTDGWTKKAQDHFSPGTGTLDNLYKIKIAGLEYETTEEQVINTIARVVKAFQKVDAADFEAKYNAKETDPTKQAQVASLLKEIQDQAAEVIVGSDKDTGGNPKQKSYDFSANYHKGKWNDNGTWQATAPDYSQPAFNYQHFFEFISLVHNQPFLNDLDATKQKNIDKNQNWTIFLKGEAWAKDKLADYGIKIDPAKTTLYKTSPEDKQTIPAGTGIVGWLELASAITNDNQNQSKLVGAFTNSPTQQLLTDLNGWTQGADGFLTDGTNYTLPESLDSMTSVLDELEGQKLNHATAQGLLTTKITEKQNTLKTKTTELKAKENQLEVLIKEIITKQREKLKGYSISNGFADTHKRTERELFSIQELLATIRYLENNGDSTLPSSETAENTAYDQINQIWDKVRQGGSEHYQIYAVDEFRNLAWKKVNDEKQEYDIPQAISRIKDGKYTDSDGKEQKIYTSLEEFNQHFAEKDKLVKLDDWETKAWAAIKIALGKTEDPTENLPDYQSKLKELDPLLTETVITQALVDDWKTQTNFKTAETMKKELAKVLKNGALDADFKKVMTTADAELTDLAKLLTKKKAKEVITLIRKWEYDQASEEKKTRQLKEIKMNLNKKPTDNLSEAEISEGLYKLAVSEFSTKTDSEITQWEKGEEQQKNPKTDEKGHFAKNWVWYLLGGSVFIGGALVMIFWEKIRGWWAKPAENEDND